MSLPESLAKAGSNQCVARPKLARAKVSWHTAWDRTVDEAFAAMPADFLMSEDIVRELWDFNRTRRQAKIAILRDSDDAPVGVIPLKRAGRFSWQLLTYYSMPYARLHVRACYVDAALRLIAPLVDCPNILTHGMPSCAQMIRPEESFILQPPNSYAEFLSQTGYGKEDRGARRRSAHLEYVEDRFEHLPLVMDHWKLNWIKRGSGFTAQFADEVLTVQKIMASRHCLKMFSMYDGKTLAASSIVMRDGTKVYGVTTMLQDEYRHTHAGIRTIVESIDWSCRNGIRDFDMLRPSSMPKQKWAKPENRGFRLLQCPMGSPAIGQLLAGIKDRSGAPTRVKKSRLNAE